MILVIRLGAIVSSIPILLLSALLVCPSLPHADADESELDDLLRPGETDPILDAMEASIPASLDQITAREINQFHRTVIDRCIRRMPANVDLSLSYDGIVANDDGNSRVQGLPHGLVLRTGHRIKGHIGQPLSWTVGGHGPSAIFSLWISIQKTDLTVSEWDGGKRTLYVNLSFIDGDWKSRDEKRPELGGQSIVEFLSLLKEKNPDVEE